jgi:glyoxylase-like metal-dependent hydrolase (beta-lactamase superfamily II)
VYYATATGTLVTGSNNVAIIGDRDVLVVDTGTTPAAARAFVEDLKAITSKPVRYVVNTHFHYDHTDGNQVYEQGRYHRARLRQASHSNAECGRAGTLQKVAIDQRNGDTVVFLPHEKIVCVAT